MYPMVFGDVQILPCLLHVSCAHEDQPYHSTEKLNYVTTQLSETFSFGKNGPHN